MTRRLLVTYLSITLATLAALALPLGFTFAARERDRITTELGQDATALAALVEDALEAGDAHEAGEMLASYDRRNGQSGVVLDGAGQVVADSGTSADTTTADSPGLAAALAGQRSQGSFSSGGRRVVYVAVPVTSGGVIHGAVRITLPRSALDDRSRSVWTGLALLSAAVLATVGGIGVLLARSVTKPVRRLEAAARSIAGGDLTARVDMTASVPELRSLAATFNMTAERLAMLVGAQERFVADAAHELRTPLTALRLRLENFESHLPEAELAKLDATVDEVRRLSWLVEGLLALARNQDGAPVLERVDVTGTVEGRVDTWQPVAGESAVTVRADVTPGLWASAAKGTVEQVLDNLIANALAACAGGGTVVVQGRPAGNGSIEFRVTDTGPGMSAEDRERAFDRFWRADRRSPGSGLGLAIVRHLVRGSGGEARLEPGPDGRGTSAVVILARGTPPPPG